MPKRYWGIGFALGLIIGVASTIILCLWLEGPQNAINGTMQVVGQASEGGAPDQKEDKQEEYAFTYWARRLFSFEDTGAQWLMTIFSIVASALLWRTLLATQEMSRDTRRIGEAQVRAYLMVKKLRFKIYDPEKQAGFLFVDVVNSGSSPARDVTIKAMQDDQVREVLVATDLAAASSDSYNIHFKLPPLTDKPDAVASFVFVVTISWRDVFFIRHQRICTFVLYATEPITSSTYELTPLYTGLSVEQTGSHK